MAKREEPKSKNKEYGRRPYIGKEDSHMNLMKKITDFLVYNTNIFPERHSEFKRPYVEDDYNEMEYIYSPHFFMNPKWWDTPDVRSTEGGTSYSWNWGWPSIDGDLEEELTKGLPGSFGCIITCINGLYCDDPIQCRLPISMAQHPIVGKTWIGWSKDADIDRLEVSDEFETYPIKIYPTTVWNIDGAKSEVMVCFEDISEQICCTTIKVFCYDKDTCCTDDTYVSVAFDVDSTPDTIVPGGSATIYITDGCPPYTWSVSDLGYTLDNASTTGLTNNLNSVAGVCGVDYDPVATVLCTDDCDNAITIKLRNTGGQWVLTNTIDCAPGGIYDSACSTITDDIKKEIRWRNGGTDDWFGGCVNNTNDYCFGTPGYSACIAASSAYTCPGSPMLMDCFQNGDPDAGYNECYRKHTIAGRNKRELLSELNDYEWQC